MTNKETRTVSLKPANNEFLSNHDNASALVDDLVTQYREGADRDTVALELQIEQKRRERRSAKKEVNRLDEDIAELERLKNEFQGSREDRLQEAKEVLSDVPREADNPAILNWAERLELTPTELIDELESTDTT